MFRSRSRRGSAHLFLMGLLTLAGLLESGGAAAQCSCPAPTSEDIVAVSPSVSILFEKELHPSPSVGVLFEKQRPIAPTVSIEHLDLDCDRLVTFDELPVGSPIGGATTSAGIEITVLSGDLQVTDAVPGPSLPTSGTRVLADPSPSPGAAGTVELSWTNPASPAPAAVSSFRCRVINADGPGVTVTAYDPVGDILSVTTVQGGPGTAELIELDDPFIARVEIELGGGPGSTTQAALDDLCFSVPFSLTAPDLEILSASLPPGTLSLSSGQGAECDWITRNRGLETATLPWEDHLYWSLDAIFDPGLDTLAAVFAAPQDLDYQAEYAADAVIVAPEVGNAPLDYYLIVRADALNQVDESYAEGNNTFVLGPFTIEPPPRPDLVVTSVTPPQSGILSGSRTTIEFTVKNEGSLPTTVPQWTDLVILSEDEELINPPFWLENEQILAEVPNPQYLAPQDSYTQPVTVSLPEDITGDFYIAVYADALPSGGGLERTFLIEEQDETNNIRFSPPFTIDLEPQPDLQVVSVGIDPFLFSGQEVTLTSTVENVNPASTNTGVWSVEYYLSPDSLPSISPGDELIGKSDSSGSPLQQNGQRPHTLDVILPHPLSGNFSLKVLVDANEQVNEIGFEGNNVGVSLTPSTVTLSPSVDLGHNQPVVSSNGPHTPGSWIEVGYGYQNYGAEPPVSQQWEDTISISGSQDPLAGPLTPLGTVAGHTTFDASLESHSIEAETPSRQLRLPLSDLSPGNYYLHVQLDSEGVVFEDGAVTNNWNTTAQPITITADVADIELVSLDVPSGSHAPGDSISLSWVASTCCAGATTSHPTPRWFDHVYISDDDQLDASDSLLQVVEIMGELLSAGSSYGSGTTIQIPNLPADTYWIIVDVDRNEAVFQSPDLAPDHLAEPITINGEVADLQPLDFNVLYDATASEWDLNWTVRNAHPTATTTSDFWIDEVWISSEPTFDPSTAELLIARTRAGSLMALEQYSFTESVAVDPQRSGSQYFFLRTDRSDHLYEADEANNELAAGTNPIFLTPMPVDLQIDTINVVGTPSAGQFITVEWTTCNQGSGLTPVGGWLDSVYLSADPVFDVASDLHLGTIPAPNVTLGYNQCYDQSEEFQIPLSVIGHRFVIVVTDMNQQVTADPPAPGGALPSYPEVEVVLPEPCDLQPTELSSGVTQASPGDLLPLTWTIKNGSGGGPLVGQWKDSFFLSTDPILDPEDVLLGTVANSSPAGGSVPPGSETSATDYLTLPGVLPGAYYILVRSDVFNVIPEIDESNNVGPPALATAMISVSLTELPIGSPPPAPPSALPDTIEVGEKRYFRMTAAAGETLRICAAHDDPESWMQVYIRHEEIPTPGAHDYSGQLPATGTQTIIIPEAEAGEHYVLVWRLAADAPSNPALEAYSLEAISLPFDLLSVEPPVVGQGLVTFRVEGSQWDQSEIAIRLRETGNPAVTIEPFQVTFTGPHSAWVRFDLEGTPLGSYDLVAEQDQGSESAALVAAVQVEAAQPLAITAEISSIPAIRTGTESTAYIVARNVGNVDATHGLVYIGTTTFDGVEFELGGEIIANDLYDSSTLRLTLLDIGNFPVGEELVIPVNIIVPGDSDAELVDLFTMTQPLTSEEFIAGPLYTMALFARDQIMNDPQALPESLELVSDLDSFYEGLTTSYLSGGAALPAGGTIVKAARSAFCRIVGKGALRIIESQALPRACLGLSLAGPWGRLASRGCILLVQVAGYIVSEGINDLCVDLLTPSNSAPDPSPSEDCPDMMIERCDQYAAIVDANGNQIGYECVSSSIHVVPRNCGEVSTSIDPNEKNGPFGFGTEAWVGIDQRIPYRIDFENLPSAEAPAARVEIRDAIQPPLVGGSVRLGKMQIGDVTIEVPPNQSSFSGVVDLTETLGVEVEIFAGVDAGQDPPQVFWIFQAIDPVTGAPPTGAFSGFLPPNDETGQGQGHVTFDVLVGAFSPTGVLLVNEADIIFDSNAPIITNRTTHRLDGDRPSSVLLGPPPPQLVSNPILLLQVSGTDEPDGSGLSHFLFWVAENDGTPTPRTMSEDGSFTLFLEPDRTYEVLSSAIDNAGNEETPQTIATVALVENFKRGELNGDGSVNIADAVLLLGHLFQGTQIVDCEKARDINDDGSVNIADAVSLLNYLFVGSADPAPPFMSCGPDPTVDNLSCLEFNNCP